MRVRQPHTHKNAIMKVSAAVSTTTEVPDLACPICSIRKEKRFCLALHDRICAQCCGEQRELTLDCPSECPYLQQAREHQPPRDLSALPPDEILAGVSVPEQFLQEHEPLIAGVLQALSKISGTHSQLRDREVIAALANMGKSYQTLVGSGLVYAEASPSPAQQAIIDMLRDLMEEYREVEQRHLGYTALKDGDILKALVFALRLAQVHTSGRPLSRAFLDFLHQRFPHSGPSLDAGENNASRIILP